MQTNNQNNGLLLLILIRKFTHFFSSSLASLLDLLLFSPLSLTSTESE
uniref:Uncharacterized protein n=1 Tax=Schistosoma curassoni TaxID=6186 RepID=A0A183JNY1_9TREM